MKKILLSFLLVYHVSTSYAQTNLDAGLVAYYPFNGNANDFSGNKNNPVFNNATLTTDRLGNSNSAYHFNGTNNYMRIRNSPSLNMTNEMSIALWIKATAFYTGKCYNNMLLMKGDEDYVQGNYFLRFADAYTGCTNPNTKKEMFYGRGGPVATTPLINLNQWYSVVWVCDNKTVSLYVDCVLRASAPASYMSFSNRYDLFIGHMNNSEYPYWLNGDLDDIRIYNRSLSKKEILLLCDKKQAPQNTEPSVDFTYTISDCSKVQFKISKSENIKTYKWELGDKGLSNKESFIHTYKNNGNYVVKLIAKSNSGKKITVSKSLTIIKPAADFIYETTAIKNTFKFSINSKDKLKYKWFFGDGDQSINKKNIVHSYKQPGTYEVALIAESKTGCSDTSRRTILIAATVISAKDTIVTTVADTEDKNIAIMPLLEKRENNLLKEIAVTNDTLAVSFYDNGEIDGDSVTIVYNDTVITTHLFLTDKAKSFMLPVNKTGAKNELIMYAENLGSIPPNTALMIVYDGSKRHEISISSSKSSNGMVRFIFKR